MPEHCPHCGAEINDNTEFCPSCNANIRAERAEAKAEMLDEANRGWQRSNKALKGELRERARVLESVMYEDRLYTRLDQLIGLNHKLDSPCFGKLNVRRVATLLDEAWKDLVYAGSFENRERTDNLCKTCTPKQRSSCAQNGPVCAQAGADGVTVYALAASDDAYLGERREDYGYDADGNDLEVPGRKIGDPYPTE
jgi:uncharacterized Zn finger protein (UPF0148 family)